MVWTIRQGESLVCQPAASCARREYFTRRSLIIALRCSRVRIWPGRDDATTLGGGRGVVGRFAQRQQGMRWCAVTESATATFTTPAAARSIASTAGRGTTTMTRPVPAGAASPRRRPRPRAGPRRWPTAGCLRAERTRPRPTGQATERRIRPAHRRPPPSGSPKPGWPKRALPQARRRTSPTPPPRLDPRPGRVTRPPTRSARRPAWRRPPPRRSPPSGNRRRAGSRLLPPLFTIECVRAGNVTGLVARTPGGRKPRRRNLGWLPTGRWTQACRISSGLRYARLFSGGFRNGRCCGCRNGNSSYSVRAGDQ